jgi:hypothetical protein
VGRAVSHQIPRVWYYSGEHMLTGTCRCRIRGFHPLWPDFPDCSAIDGFVTPQCFRNPGPEFQIRNRVIQNWKFWPGLGYVRFRSPLLTESMSLSFPPGTKMFQFPGFASQRLYIQRWMIPINRKRVSAFRNLRINACLPASRSISQATTSFVASRCQGIHHTPLVA